MIINYRNPSISLKTWKFSLDFEISKTLKILKKNSGAFSEIDFKDGLNYICRTNPNKNEIRDHCLIVAPFFSAVYLIKIRQCRQKIWNLILKKHTDSMNIFSSKEDIEEQVNSNKVVIMYPNLTRRFVKATAKKRKRLPPKSTRHVFKFKTQNDMIPNINIPLNVLKTQESFPVKVYKPINIFSFS